MTFYEKLKRNFRIYWMRDEDGAMKADAGVDYTAHENERDCHSHLPAFLVGKRDAST